MSDTQVSDAVTYRPVKMHNGRYRFRRVPLNNLTGSEVTLSQTATTLAEFKIPAGQVFNPSRSFIDYQLEIPAQGAGKYIWAFNDTFEIASSIQFCNASGMFLTDLQFCNKYVAAVRKLDTNLEEYLSLEPTTGLSKFEGVPADNYFPPGVPAPGADNVWGEPNVASDVAISLLDPRYARSTGDAGGVANAGNLPLTLARSVPLSALKHTALAMDKDMIFGEDIYIRIQVAPYTQVAYTTTSKIDPSSAPAVLDPSPAKAPKVRNFQLQLAHQVDPDLEAAVRTKFLKGDLKFMIPYVYGWRTATVNAGVANIQIQLNNQLGKKLKRMVHIPFDSTELLNLTYDHQNVNGSKIIQYQTMLDSQPLQDYQLSCLQPVTGGARGMDDFRENFPLLRGSAIQGSASYYLNWLHVDSWSQPKRDARVPEENIFEGLDLALPKSWGIQATTTGSLTHYTFGEFIREVHSLPQGLQIVVA